MLEPEALVDGVAIGLEFRPPKPPPRPKPPPGPFPPKPGWSFADACTTVAASEPSELSVPWAVSRSPTATLASVGAETPRTEYLVAEETSTVTVLPAVVVTTIVVAVLLATIPPTDAGAIATAVAVKFPAESTVP